MWGILFTGIRGAAPRIKKIQNGDINPKTWEAEKKSHIREAGFLEVEEYE